MKRNFCLAILISASTTSFAYTEQLSHSELKSMDCSTLAVEQSNAKRAVESAEKSIQALNIAGSKTEKIKGSSQTTLQLSHRKAEENTASLSIYQENKANAQANLKNIAIFQNTNKCKL